LVVGDQGHAGVLVGSVASTAVEDVLEVGLGALAVNVGRGASREVALVSASLSEGLARCRQGVDVGVRGSSVVGLQTSRASAESRRWEGITEASLGIGNSG